MRFICIAVTEIKKIYNFDNSKTGLSHYIALITDCMTPFRSNKYVAKSIVI